MTRSTALCLFAIAFTSGCRMCSNSCDYSSPLVYSSPEGYSHVSDAPQADASFGEAFTDEQTYEQAPVEQGFAGGKLTPTDFIDNAALPVEAAQQDGEAPVISTADYLDP